MPMPFIIYHMSYTVGFLCIPHVILQGNDFANSWCVTPNTINIRRQNDIMLTRHLSFTLILSIIVTKEVFGLLKDLVVFSYSYKYIPLHVFCIVIKALTNKSHTGCIVVTGAFLSDLIILVLRFCLFHICDGLCGELRGSCL